MKKNEFLEITYEEARSIATKEARSILSLYLKNSSMEVLEQSFLEASHCWMFFKNKGIITPPEHALNGGAYVVSKKGTFRYTADFSNDREKLQDYLQTMSNYFKERNE